jgi:hypothetical protein
VFEPYSALGNFVLVVIVIIIVIIIIVVERSLKESEI